MSTPYKHSIPTFGTSLKVLCEHSGTEIPVLLASILRTLAAHGLNRPDIFAQLSKSPAVTQLKCAIDSCSSLTELLEAYDAALVGSLLKRWLEELPDPLLDWQCQVEFLSTCNDDASIEARIANLNNAVALVDPITLGTLKPLLLFLQQYCFRQRRFDQQLLQVAVAFAPILFPAALAAGPAELRLAEETVATLVSNALHVFNPTLAANVPVVTPQALCEAVVEAMEPSQHLRLHASAGEQQGFTAPVETGAQRLLVPGTARDTGSCDGQYEPYLQDAEFLCALDVMVSGCVTSALFSPDDDDGDYVHCGTDDECASITSSSNTIFSMSDSATSSGGAGSSGGASSCSTAGASHAAECAGATAQRRRSSYGGHRCSHQSHHNRHLEEAHSRREHSEGGACEPPYSPRTELLPSPPVELSQAITAAGAEASAAAKASVSKGSPLLPSSVVLADLAQREAAEGNVICIISAQSCASALAASAATALAAGGSAALAKPAAVKVLREAGAQRQQQLKPLDLVEIHTALLGGRREGQSLVVGSKGRRSTEGGAVAGAGDAGHACVSAVQGATVRPASHTLPGDQPQRRMSMGGNSSQGGEQNLKVTAVTASNASAALSQPEVAQPQRRQSMGGINTSGGGAALSNADTNKALMTPLGIAGYFSVSVTASHTLEVRELSTPEAAAHKLPIRGLSMAAMQAEKERLKRQLKDVAAAYEVCAGRPLTPALKEPLRPVYVRYHKIKALLAAGGSAVQAAGSGGRREGAVAMGVTAAVQRQVVLTTPPNAVTV